MTGVLLFLGGFVTCLWIIWIALEVQDLRECKRMRRGGMIDLTGKQITSLGPGHAGGADDFAPWDQLHHERRDAPEAVTQEDSHGGGTHHRPPYLRLVGRK